MEDQHRPFVGKRYIFDYNGFVAHDHFVDDKILRFEVTAGPVKGHTGEVRYQAEEIAAGIYLISWQEAGRHGGTPRRLQ
ncbi:MoaF-related domain-containing protein [Pectobacterium aroidearum]|uniref:MoaF-related domain-containing protein n=1 Tax=Pectobacterium aroidearum TaxID=1201031 RepID=UPI0032EDEA19